MPEIKANNQSLQEAMPSVVSAEAVVDITVRANLGDITEQILSHKHRIEQSFIEMGKLLIEAKKELPHGHWLPWLSSNVEVSAVTAQRLMRLAEEFSNASPVTQLGYTKASILLKLPKNEIGNFMEETHEINGREKSVADMSKRELEMIVRERKKTTARVIKTKPNGNFIMKPIRNNHLNIMPYTDTHLESKTFIQTEDGFEEYYEGLMKYLNSASDTFDNIEYLSNIYSEVVDHIDPLDRIEPSIKSIRLFITDCIEGTYDNDLRDDYYIKLHELSNEILKSVPYPNP